MNDLRRELREAFERRQAGLGDLTNVRHRMLRTALTAAEPRRTQVFRAAVGLAAVLIAAIAVGATIYIRARTHALPAASQTPSASASAQPSLPPAPTPTALTNPLQVSASTPVILFHDPVNRDQIDGITWDGAASGRISASAASFGFTPNAAGTLSANFGDQSIRDRSGQVIARYDTGNQKVFGIWADDGRHWCQMMSASQVPPAGGEPATLRLGGVGSTTKNVAQVGMMFEQVSTNAIACSLLADRAVVVQSGGQGIGTAQFWVVTLSTGRIVWTRSYTLNVKGTITIAASRDGRYIAEIQRDGTQPPSTTIYGPTGAAAAHVAGAVEGFSWDGTLAVVSAADRSVSLVQWQDGKSIWTAPKDLTFGYVLLAEPGGQRIAVGLSNPQYPQNSGVPLLDVFVIGPDGHATLLLQRVGI